MSDQRTAIPDWSQTQGIGLLSHAAVQIARLRWTDQIDGIDCAGSASYRSNPGNLRQIMQIIYGSQPATSARSYRSGKISALKYLDHEGIDDLDHDLSEA